MHFFQYKRESNSYGKNTKSTTEPHPGTSDSRHSTPRSETGQPRCEKKAHSGTKVIMALQSHSSLLNATIKVFSLESLSNKITLR